MADVYGFRAWDASGNITQDITDRLPRIIGVLTLSSNGSVIINEAGSQNDIFFNVVSLSSNPVVPNISVSGTTLSWSNIDGTWATQAILIYGVY